MSIDFYPEIEPYRSFRLKVSELHELHVEEAGNPHGKPILFLHGGPGAGLSVKHRRYFDPSHYRIILFDQRGAGRSTPFAELRENTTWDLVADIETIRGELGIERWHVFGGSWGSTLALAYAQTHPQAVTALILRGIFLCRPEEIRWFYQEGASWIFTDFWQDFLAPVASEKRGDMVRAYYELLTSPDLKVRERAAKAWSVWEGSTAKLRPDPETIAAFGGDAMSLAIARIECHYFINNCFFTKPNQLLAGMDGIRHIPGVIIQGRYDIVCPFQSAFELSQAWPEADFRIVENAGHAADELGIRLRLIEATNRFRAI